MAGGMGGGGFGAPPMQQGYGAPQGQGFGAPPQDFGNPGAMQQAYGGQPMMAPGGGAMAGAHGPKGLVRNSVMVLVYSVLSCGIYQMIWMVSICNEMKAYLQRDEPNGVKVLLLGMVTCGIYFLYWMFASAGPAIQEMQQRAGIANPTNPGIMLLIPYYGVIVMQEELNKVWSAPG
jgi:hypothetical protein